MGHCPACHCEMESTAIVAAFNDPPGAVDIYWRPDRAMYANAAQPVNL